MELAKRDNLVQPLKISIQCILQRTYETARLARNPRYGTMSSLKRKDAPGGAPAAKSPKRSKSDKPHSKQNANSSEPSKQLQQKPVSAPGVSRLKEEEPLFPRGGGSVLSPLEHRQISIQAKQDVLFEHESGQGAKKAEQSLKRKKSKTPKSKLPNGGRSAEDVVRIESLNYQVSCLAGQGYFGQGVLTRSSVWLKALLSWARLLRFAHWKSSSPYRTVFLAMCQSLLSRMS